MFVSQSPRKEMTRNPFTESAHGSSASGTCKKAFRRRLPGSIVFTFLKHLNWVFLMWSSISTLSFTWMTRLHTLSLRLILGNRGSSFWTLAPRFLLFWSWSYPDLMIIDKSWKMDKTCTLSHFSSFFSNTEQSNLLSINQLSFSLETDLEMHYPFVNLAWLFPFVSLGPLCTFALTFKLFDCMKTKWLQDCMGKSLNSIVQVSQLTHIAIPPLLSNIFGGETEVEKVKPVPASVKNDMCWSLGEFLWQFFCAYASV